MWLKRRHSCNDVVPRHIYVRAPAGGETKKRREEESRPNPLHSRGAVAEAGIWLIYRLLSVCNNRRLYPPLIHPAINNRPLRSLHAARNRGQHRPSKPKREPADSRAASRWNVDQKLSFLDVALGTTKFRMSITCPELHWRNVYSSDEIRKWLFNEEFVCVTGIYFLINVQATLSKQRCKCKLRHLGHTVRSIKQFTNVTLWDWPLSNELT